MDTKFSKSPWMVTPQGPADANGMGICSMWGEGKELMANIDLIAAAPDMYAMLESYHENIEFRLDNDALSECDIWDLKDARRNIEDLLAKARGE